MEKNKFGRTASGKQAWLYTIKNQNGMEIALTDYGARLVSVKLNGRKNKRYDVVLGYDDVAMYEKDSCCFGAIIGRNANRIRNAEFSIDGKLFKLAQNEYMNNSHSGPDGYQFRFWSVKEQMENGICFALISPHMDQGFPGQAEILVTYILTDENEMKIYYNAVSDRKTIFNLTHHSYFNLDGHDSGNVYKNKLKIYASEYSPIDEWSIPTGIHESVKNTPMDFSVWKKIGKDIENDYEQLNLTKGYNHNYILEKKSTGLVAEAEGNQSGIKMEVYTDLPGLQLYTGSHIEKVVGKGGVIYSRAQGFCLEAQYVPNAVNEKTEIKPIFEAGSSYIKYVSYKFFSEGNKNIRERGYT